MEEKSSPKYTLSVAMEPIKLPPVSDILVLAKRHPQGKVGVMESFRFIAPDEFEMIDIPDDGKCVEAVLINKRILKKIPAETVLSVLEQYVFPHVSAGEAIKVDLHLKLTYEGIQGTVA